VQTDGKDLDVVREALEARNRLDRNAFLAHFAPEAEWLPTDRFPELRPVYRGRDEIWEYICLIEEILEGVTIAPEELFQVGDTVVLHYLISGRSKRSGEQVEQYTTVLFTMRNGRITRAVNYADHDEALTDAQRRLG
jgi:ketosteroid isomerase-like protein